MPAPMLIDSHAHLDMKPMGACVGAVLARAAEAGVDRVITIGIDLASSRRAIELARQHSGVEATAGIHPHNAGSFEDRAWSELEALFTAPEVRAIGEIGLDYFYDFAPRARQRAVMQRQLVAAAEHRRPVVVHLRDAWDDGFAIVQETGLAAGGVMHCFTGGPAEVERALELGFHISFSGLVTFPKAQLIREAAPCVPDDRLLVETDAPFLTPIPHRGRKNEPAFVVHTARALAELRDTPYPQIAALTRQNTRRLFGLAESG